MDVKCRGELYDYIARAGKQKVEIDLNWKLDLREENGRLLGGRGIISRQTELSIEQDGKEFDWWQPFEERGPGNLWVSIDEGNNLSLQIQYDQATGRNVGRSEGVGVRCGTGEVKVLEGARGSRIYSLSTRARTGRIYDQVDTGQKLEINVSLKSCEVKEKEVECSLNVVTKIN